MAAGSEEGKKKQASRPGGPGGDRGMLSLEDLRKMGEAGEIDTVVTAFTDMQGRLVGKRIQVEYFLEEATGHGVEGCNYLLALDMEMEPLPGYELANWEEGYGDFGSPRLVYNLGHALYEFIEARWGKDGVRQFLFSLRKSAIGGGSSPYEEAFQMTAREFDQQFEKYLKDRFKAFQGDGHAVS